MIHDYCVCRSVTVYITHSTGHAVRFLACQQSKWRSLCSAIFSVVSRHYNWSAVWVRIYLFCVSTVFHRVQNYWHWSHSLRWIYATVRCPSVCPSVCPVYRPLQQCAAGCCCGSRGQKISIDNGAAAATALSNKREQCHIVSWLRQMNTDLYLRKDLIFFNLYIP